MKSINILIAMLLSAFALTAQIKNEKIAAVKIYGNCDICETTIEKAGNVMKQALVNWSKDSKTATIAFDSIATTEAEILKRIALAGYDNDLYLAPDKTYAALPECCRYERLSKTITHEETAGKGSHSMHTAHSTVQQQTNQLKTVFDRYFGLKDALVKSDGNTASTLGKALDDAIHAVKADKLSVEEHTVFMKLMKDLSFDAEHIAETKETSHQREHFISLSKNIYELIKIVKFEVPVYYQHCPMFNDGKGANWLSKESIIKNPYYGSQMLSCGKTVETIQ